ncbi:hypothetical protein BCAH1134_C0252 (plasmid) [Bacillus cereus AH1134]|nr:hypothetical protein BCAH1134_C0252 [Bacillus cereus AH1134]
MIMPHLNKFPFSILIMPFFRVILSACRRLGDYLQESWN